MPDIKRTDLVASVDQDRLVIPDFLRGYRKSKETLAMKTLLQSERLGNIGMRGQDESAKRGTKMISAGIGLLVFCLVNGTGVAAAAGACRQTTQSVARSCEIGAQSDYWLALAKCANVSQAAERTKCQQQALADQRDALQKCDDQEDARQAVCGRLGEAAYDPVIHPANFVAKIDNPYFPLTPGTTFIYEGQTAQGLEHSEFFVTHNTKVILGVSCIEVRDTVHINGELTEDTLDWFTQDKAGNVWYFGENAKQIAGGLIVGVEGSWTAGVDGAKPGIIMEAHPAVSDFYRQEFALDTAEDVAEVVSLKESVTVPYHSGRCLKTKETSPLEPDVVENKFYCLGIGNVLTVDLTSGERLELIQIKTK